MAKGTRMTALPSCVTRSATRWAHPSLATVRVAWVERSMLHTTPAPLAPTIAVPAAQPLRMSAAATATATPARSQVVVDPFHAGGPGSIGAALVRSAGLVTRVLG